MFASKEQKYPFLDKNFQLGDNSADIGACEPYFLQRNMMDQRYAIPKQVGERNVYNRFEAITAVSINSRGNQTADQCAA